VNRWTIYSNCSIFACCSPGALPPSAPGAERTISLPGATELADGPFGDARVTTSPGATPVT
jgi:hypothetical protein